MSDGTQASTDILTTTKNGIREMLTEPTMTNIPPESRESSAEVSEDSTGTAEFSNGHEDAKVGLQGAVLAAPDTHQDRAMLLCTAALGHRSTAKLGTALFDYWSGHVAFYLAEMKTT